MEFIKACQDRKWSQDTNTPHRSGTNRIAERAVRRARAGTATATVQSGRPDEWWDCATECCCYLRNVHDKLADDMVAEQRVTRNRQAKSLRSEPISWRRRRAWRPWLASVAASENSCEHVTADQEVWRKSWSLWLMPPRSVDQRLEPLKDTCVHCSR